MPFRLPTVRAKLTALVSLSVVVMLAALPVLSWLLHRQLVDEVDDRVDRRRARVPDRARRRHRRPHARVARPRRPTAPTARAIQRRDADARPAARAASSSTSTRTSTSCSSSATGTCSRRSAASTRPSDVDGDRRARRPAEGQGVPGRRRARVRVADVGRAAGVRHRRARRAASGGVVVCLPVDAEYLKNSSAKLGLELALARARSERRSHASSARRTSFPTARSAPRSAATRRSSTSADQSWAVAALRAAAARRGASGTIGMVAALDVTDIHAIVRRNLLYALGVLARRRASSRSSFGCAPRVA